MTSMNMKEVLYVLGLKKNLLSISALDKKGYRVAFIDGKVLMWSLEKNEDCTNSKDIQRQPLSMRLPAHVNCGIGGLLTPTIKHRPM